MVCSICGVNESMLSITVVYNGKKTNVHLCSECISKFGLDANNVENLIKEVVDLISKNIIRTIDSHRGDLENEELEEEFLSFDNIIGMIASGKEGSDPDNTRRGEGKSMNKKANDQVCPYCGTSLEEIIGGTHLGCIGCFEHFRDRIKRKPARFEGRVPRVYRSIYIRDKLKDYLSDRMMAEVVRENFEEASKIRKIMSEMMK